MMLKKFYADSVEEAREKASGSLGQTYIVVETKAAVDDEPAWIHVLDEEEEGSKEKGSATYSRRDLFPKALSKLKETVNDSLQLFNTESRKELDFTEKPEVPREENALKDERFIPYKTIAQTAQKPQPKEAENNAALQEEFKALSARFKRLEELVSAQMIGVHARYVSHPAFQQLLERGVPHAILTQWFNELIHEGADPFGREGNFMHLLAQKVKQTLDVAVESDPAKFMLFTGAPGAGKSSLIMKLVLHPEMLTGASCALITVAPRGTKNYYPPLTAFASEHDLVHFVIEEKKQLKELEKEFTDFDHVLVEMPSTEFRGKSSIVSADTFLQIFGKEAPVEVHRVVDATKNPEVLEKELQTMDDSSSCFLDITHLDGTPKKGHLLTLMQQPGCAVKYITSGVQVPDHISAFEPALFARQLLSNV